MDEWKEVRVRVQEKRKGLFRPPAKTFSVPRPPPEEASAWDRIDGSWNVWGHNVVRSAGVLGLAGLYYFQT
ncbi:MAG: hypothetical protein ACYTFG_07670, partial [Planctomycetota bacterium]